MVPSFFNKCKEEFIILIRKSKEIISLVLKCFFFKNFINYNIIIFLMMIKINIFINIINIFLNFD